MALSRRDRLTVAWDEDILRAEALIKLAIMGRSLTYPEFRRWKRLLLDSNAENFLEHAPCPVLVVH
jgi:nucleotide-binding universal stress UspA family protein